MDCKFNARCCITFLELYWHGLEFSINFLVLLAVLFSHIVNSLKIEDADLVYYLLRIVCWMYVERHMLCRLNSIQYLMSAKQRALKNICVYFMHLKGKEAKGEERQNSSARWFAFQMPAVAWWPKMWCPNWLLKCGAKYLPPECLFIFYYF